MLISFWTLSTRLNEAMNQYNKTFETAIDSIGQVGEKLGAWVNRGGWRIILGIATGLLILVFGGAKLLESFGHGLFNGNKYKE